MQVNLNQANGNEESSQFTMSFIQSSFKMDQFWYALIFGLLPTAWDVRTDVNLGETLERASRVFSAALCWLLVCSTPILSIAYYIGKVTNSRLAVLIVKYGLFAILIVLVMHYPWAPYYPAVFISIVVVTVKILAVLLHTPGMTKLSARFSLYECAGEASGQIKHKECVNRENIYI